jgi:hypothetical protein
MRIKFRGKMMFREFPGTTSFGLYCILRDYLLLFLLTWGGFGKSQMWSWTKEHQKELIKPSYRWKEI